MRRMNDADVLQRIADLGHELPPAPVPVAAYVPVRIAGATAYVAGQVPIVDGVVVNPGLLGRDVSVDEGRAGAERAALQALSALRAALGSFDRLLGILQVTVYVASTPDFAEHPQVANGASELLVNVLGETGRHARAAIGMSSLPLGGSVEVVVTAEIAPA
jgi:enamine deaminase RidA (YjgF/YER057c/UK114 family)